MTTDNIQAMSEAGVHLGYSKASLHPSVAKSVYGVKNRSVIINLEKTAEQLEAACKFLAEVSKTGKIIFVGSKNEIRHIVSGVASELHMPSVTTRWIGGTLTNFSEIKKRISKYNKMIADREAGAYDKFNKKEKLKLDREIEKLAKHYHGVRELTELPKALVVVDPKEEEVATLEAIKLSIPVVALANTDTNIEGIAHAVICNDGAISSVSYLLDELTKACKA